jgi:hypothetical protein
MHPLRKKLIQHPLVRAGASVKITVVCLILLFILTLWGTIDQVSNGLYLAQARFFNSLVFTFWGFVPFPGARLVLWVLFFNLVSAAIVRLVARWSRAGIIITHFGLLLFFIAAFVTFHGVEEGQVTLREGEAANVSQSYHSWELSVWTGEDNNKQVVAVDADRFAPGQTVRFEKYGLTATVKSYFRNCDAYTGPGQGGARNTAGIQTLKPLPLDQAPEKNMPGGVFRLRVAGQGEEDILLYAGESSPLKVVQGEKTYYFMLRHKRSPLPFTVRLKDFMMERHPNTEVARSYQSLVEVLSRGASREVLISMNEPLRYKQYTLYQSSYAVDSFGRESSTLAVVKNAGRLLPYIATLVTAAGLAAHLLILAFESKFKARREKQ